MIKKFLLSLSLLSSISVCAEVTTDPITYDQYINYSTLSENMPVQLDLMNQIIQYAGGIEKIKLLAKKSDDKASFVLGNLYLQGKSFPKDIEKGIEILENASDGEYSSFSLGLHYLDANDEFRYSTEVKKYGADLIYHSASLGLEEAEYIAAQLLIEGKYLERDRDIAIMLLNSASSKGYTPAISLLASIRNTHQELYDDYDHVQARANEGYIPAIIKLAGYYIHGWKVQEDREKGIRLLEYAKAQGSEDASLKLSKLTYH